MIDFQRLTPERKDDYQSVLFAGSERGCEYSFANLLLWGHQKVAFLQNCVVFFSHFQGRSVYPYPIGTGSKKAAVEAILQDAQLRGIPCRITGITAPDKQELEQLFPGTFLFCPNRDSFDYVYDINDLADLKGRKFQSKRNHFNRFCTDHPDHQVVAMTADNLPLVREFVDAWFARRQEADPQGDFFLEKLAISRVISHWQAMDMEGLILMDQDAVLAVTIGSRQSPNTFDIHFEKAREDVPGAYNAINCHFARYLRLKHPEVAFLNREDDMGLEGLRNAKLSYRPHHLVEKYWAYVQEAIHED